MKREIKTDFKVELTCEKCGKKFEIYKKAQCRKKYCSDTCRRAAENERKKIYNEKAKAKKKYPRKKKSTSGIYRDPDTGALYYVKEDDKLLQIDKICKEKKLSYGEYTSREYAPRIYYPYPIDKEKEHKPPTFKWKSGMKKKRKEATY